jgi:arylsulfatase A-like enzyme
MKVKLTTLVWAIGLIGASTPASFADTLSGPNAELDRTSLPIKEPARATYSELDARNVKPPARFEVKAPANAPNVLIVLIDDMGFGMPSTFGGPVNMPTADALAKDGLRYNRFHTTAMCSPTRAALLTGRNHHSNNMGAIAEDATGFPGNTGVRPNDIAPLAEVLRLNGYNTAHFGKSHEVAPWQINTSGPYNDWPVYSGFEHFYGFLGAETNQWYPILYQDNTQIEQPKDPNYHFMKDMTDHAISWVRAQHSLTPDKPFFMYFAPGATHTPHQVPAEWIAKYKGKFDMGWDALREQTLQRQKALGIVPADTKLAPKPSDIKDWSQYTDIEKKALERQMELYAAYGEFADYHVGRLINSLKDLGVLDNTLVIYILGDNGDSPEGGLTGGSEVSFINGAPDSLKDYYDHLSEQGGPKSYPHYAGGWAVAGDTPFTWTKEVAANFGGTRNGMIVSWPKYISEPGGVRSQFAHVIDVDPTILEAAHLPQPKEVDGVAQHPIEGVSFLDTFNDATQKERHTTQYFELLGSRAIYSDGWIAAAVHRDPWKPEVLYTLQNDKWELYDTRADFSESTDLSSQHPEKLKELQALFMSEAQKYHVLPIDDRGAERLNPALAGRPDLMEGRTSLTLYPDTPGLAENAFINMKNTSFTIDAQLDSTANANGVILCQGGRSGGWSLYVVNGKPKFQYNWLGRIRYSIMSNEALPKGASTVRFEFAYDGGGLGKGGKGTIFIDGKKVGEGRIDKTQPYVITTDETADVGLDRGAPVSDDYKPLDNAFKGTVKKVTISVQSKKTPAEAKQEKDGHDAAIEANQ